MKVFEKILFDNHNYLGDDEPMTIGAKSNDIVAPLRAVDAIFFPLKKRVPIGE